MLINARSPDWNLLMGPIWWRTGYLISSKCCNSNNKNTFALLHELRMHHVQQLWHFSLAQTLAALQLRNVLYMFFKVFWSSVCSKTWQVRGTSSSGRLVRPQKHDIAPVLRCGCCLPKPKESLRMAMAKAFSLLLRGHQIKTEKEQG